MSGDISGFIRRALEKLPADRRVTFKSGGDLALIRCPNVDHKGGMEENPSMRINVSRSGKYWPGSGKCFSCGFKVKNWNELAAYINGELIDGTGESGSTEEFAAAPIFDDKLRALFERDEDEDERLDVIKWDTGQKWRNISGKLLSQIGAGLIFDKEFQRMYVYLPCMVNRKRVGFIRANIVKQGKLNYFNSDGTWTNEKGLFPYDFSKALIKRRKLKAVVLVEGPRDALRCLQYGIPAIACLGASNWSDMKTELIVALKQMGVTLVVTAFDPDEAGDNITKIVNSALKDEFTVRRFRFPTVEECGKKIDPGNMPRDLVMKMKNTVYKADKHHDRLQD